MKVHAKMMFAFLLMSLMTFSTIFAQESNAELKQKFQQMNDKFVEAMMNDNNEAILEYYTDDAISLPSYQPMVKGKDALRKQMKEDENNPMEMKDFKLTTKEVFSSGDYAYEVGAYKLTMEGPGMENGWTDEGKYLTVYEKQSDGNWKVKAETWNTDNNPWQQMEEQKKMDHDKNMEDHHMKDKSEKEYKDKTKDKDKMKDMNEEENEESENDDEL